MATSTHRSSHGLDSPRSDEWTDHAACRPGFAKLTPNAWNVNTSKPTRTNRDAAKICNRECPVRDQCRAWYDGLDPALRHNVIAAGMHWNSAGIPTAVVEPERSGKEPSADDLLTVVWAAELAETNEMQILGACGKGELTATKDVRNRWRIRRGDLLAWLGVSDG